jgi:hypothetical protein
LGQFDLPAFSQLIVFEPVRTSSAMWSHFGAGQIEMIGMGEEKSIETASKARNRLLILLRKEATEGRARAALFREIRLSLVW